MSTYDLVQTFGSSETCWAGADDEDVDFADNCEQQIGCGGIEALYLHFTHGGGLFKRWL
jgi:hypothetical protein